MSGSQKWSKGLAGSEKDLCKMGDGDGVRRKGIWKKFWRSRSRGSHVSPSEILDASSVADVFQAAMAAVVRAPPTEFMAVHREWAAIRIQAAFRGLLARRALRALQGLVRVQAFVRGWLVRKQVVVTLRRLETVVRLGARQAAERTARLSGDGYQDRRSNSRSVPGGVSDLDRCGCVERRFCEKRSTEVEDEKASDHTSARSHGSSNVKTRASHHGAHRSASSYSSEVLLPRSPAPSPPSCPAASSSSSSRGAWALVPGKSLAISSSEREIRMNQRKSVSSSIFSIPRGNSRRQTAGDFPPGRKAASCGGGVSWRCSSQRRSTQKQPCAAIS